MIHIVIGTKAQLIKMAPVMRALGERGIPYRYLATGQHRDTMEALHANFGIRPPDLRLYAGPDITRVASMGRWAAAVLWGAWRRRREVFGDGRTGVVVVHGDTLSTLLGALMGRLAGLPVAHVESGLRSFDVRNPFPEELIRLATFSLSRLYFCPGAWALGNVARYRGTKVDTGANTLSDALALAEPITATPPPGLVPDGPFGVVSIHRYENIASRAALTRVVAAVEQVAASHRLLFVLHKPTAERLARFGLRGRIEAHPRIETRPRYDYLDFIALIRSAELVVSDGGSNQEECAYLGKPLLLLRERSERMEGLGENVVLSAFEPERIAHFRDYYQSYRRPPLTPTGEPGGSPSGIIAEALRPFAAGPINASTRPTS